MYTVVVADDEEELRKALIKRVNWDQAGFRVVGEAENGVEALELVEQLKPDLLLTDIQMPFISGIELAREVREIRPNMQIAFLSGYDEFSYAQQAIQYNIISYILKPISAAELTEELHKIKEKIDDKFREFISNTSEHSDWIEITDFLMPLALDEFQEDTKERNEKLLQRAKSCGMILDVSADHRFCVMVSSIFDRDGTNHTTPTSVNGIDIILRKYMKHVSFFVEGRVVSVLTATQTGFEKYLHIAVEDIIQSVQRIMQQECIIGVSRVVLQLTRIHEAYTEAVNAARYSQRMDNSLHFITDIEGSQEMDVEHYIHVIAEAEERIRSGSAEELKEYLEGFFLEMQEKHYAPATVSFIMMQMVSAVYKIVYTVVESDNVGQLQAVSTFQNMNLTIKISEMQERCIDFCLRAKELITDQRKKSTSVLCDRALAMIEKNYMDCDISLVSISSEIAVSPNYLSSIIKKETGSTFIDLLTKKRIETARELLLTTSMKIREITERCGYSDQHYFSYCFRKYTGVSPNACRRQNELENPRET